MDKSLSGKLAQRISMRQLQVFEAVARLLSFTRAAEELFLAQPTVSMQIKKLEHDTGLALTEQVGKKISLTDAGKALYLDCRLSQKPSLTSCSRKALRCYPRAYSTSCRPILLICLMST